MLFSVQLSFLDLVFLLCIWIHFHFFEWAALSLTWECRRGTKKVGGKKKNSTKEPTAFPLVLFPLAPIQNYYKMWTFELYSYFSIRQSYHSSYYVIHDCSSMLLYLSSLPTPHSCPPTFPPSAPDRLRFILSICGCLLQAILACILRNRT